jgi:hypothetical protein
MRTAGVPQDDPSYGNDNPFAQFARMQAFGPMINGLLDDAEQFAIGDTFISPSDAGFQLAPGAEFAPGGSY